MGCVNERAQLRGSSDSKGYYVMACPGATVHELRSAIPLLGVRMFQFAGALGNARIHSTFLGDPIPWATLLSLNRRDEAF